MEEGGGERGGEGVGVLTNKLLKLHNNLSLDFVNISLKEGATRGKSLFSSRESFPLISI